MANGHPFRTLVKSPRTNTYTPDLHDAVTQCDHSGGPVLACQEWPCEALVAHAHSKRAYLVWRNPERRQS